MLTEFFFCHTPTTVVENYRSVFINKLLIKYETISLANRVNVSEGRCKTILNCEVLCSIGSLDSRSRRNWKLISLQCKRQKICAALRLQCRRGALFNQHATREWLKDEYLRRKRLKSGGTGWGRTIISYLYILSAATTRTVRQNRSRPTSIFFTFWHLLPHVELLHYKARRTSTRTEISLLVVQRRFISCSVNDRRSVRPTPWFKKRHRFSYAILAEFHFYRAMLPQSAVMQQ